MSYDYIGEKEPNQIVWYGEARDLYYFINWFAGDHVYKKWEKQLSIMLSLTEKLLKQTVLPIRQKLHPNVWMPL